VANVFLGIFKGCVRIADAKEYQVVKYKGRFTFYQVSFGSNDREVYTSSPLYLEEGQYFSADQFVATDGAIEGNGRFLCSYKKPCHDPDKIAFNNAF
jgi:hypothetical protein